MKTMKTKREDPMKKVEVHFRPGHRMGTDGRCLVCGVSSRELRKWPLLLCMPEGRPYSTAPGAPAGEVVYESEES